MQATCVVFLCGMSVLQHNQTQIVSDIQMVRALIYMVFNVSSHDHCEVLNVGKSFKVHTLARCLDLSRM